MGIIPKKISHVRNFLKGSITCYFPFQLAQDSFIHLSTQNRNPEIQIAGVFPIIFNRAEDYLSVKVRHKTVS